MTTKTNNERARDRWLSPKRTTDPHKIQKVGDGSKSGKRSEKSPSLDVAWVDGGVDANFATALNLAGGTTVDCVHLEKEDRRAILVGAGPSVPSVLDFVPPPKQVLVSFPVRPTTGDVVCGFEVVGVLRRDPTTTEEMESLVSSGYGRKDDKRVMITLSSSLAAPFGERVAATEVLLDWTDWSLSPARGLNRFVPFDSDRRPIWFPACALTLGNARFHLLVSEALADKCDFHLLVRSLLSEELRRAAEKGKLWKLSNGRKMVYNAHADPGRHFRVE